MSYTKMTKAELIKLVQELDRPAPDVEGLKKDLEIAKKGIRAKDTIIIELKEKVSLLEANLKTTKDQARVEIRKEFENERKLLREKVEELQSHVEIFKSEYDHVTQGVLEFDGVVSALLEKNKLNEILINTFVSRTRQRYVQETQAEQPKQKEE